jgi:hypothetical protein
MDGSHHRANADVPEDPEEYISALIRGDIPYVQEDAPEDAGVDLEEDLGEDEDPSSFLNTSGDGMEIDLFDEGQTNNDDEGQINIDGEVLEPIVFEYIYVLSDTMH